MIFLRIRAISVRVCCHCNEHIPLGFCNGDAGVLRCCYDPITILPQPECANHCFHEIGEGFVFNTLKMKHTNAVKPTSGHSRRLSPDETFVLCSAPPLSPRIFPLTLANVLFSPGANCNQPLQTDAVLYRDGVGHVRWWRVVREPSARLRAHR